MLLGVGPRRSLRPRGCEPAVTWSAIASIAHIQRLHGAPQVTEQIAAGFGYAAGAVGLCSAAVAPSPLLRPSHSLKPCSIT